MNQQPQTLQQFSNTKLLLHTTSREQEVLPTGKKRMMMENKDHLFVLHHLGQKFCGILHLD
jgi:hypothetical protein